MRKIEIEKGSDFVKILKRRRQISDKFKQRIEAIHIPDIKLAIDVKTINTRETANSN